MLCRMLESCFVEEYPVYETLINGGLVGRSRQSCHVHNHYACAHDLVPQCQGEKKSLNQEEKRMYCSIIINSFAEYSLIHFKILHNWDIQGCQTKKIIIKKRTAGGK